MSHRKDRERAAGGLVYRNGQLTSIITGEQQAKLNEAIQVKLNSLPKSREEPNGEV